MSELAEVIARWRTDAAVLSRTGHQDEAEMRLRMAAEVEESAAPWLTWLSETSAMMRSRRSRAWLRSRFADWEQDGHARMHGRDRQYREAIVPRHHAASDPHADGVEAGKKMRELAS